MDHAHSLDDGETSRRGPVVGRLFGSSPNPQSTLKFVLMLAEPITDQRAEETRCRLTAYDFLGAKEGDADKNPRAEQNAQNHRQLDRAWFLLLSICGSVHQI